MNKKRIVHIVPTFGQGGVQTAMLYSIDDLSKVFDYKILVITDVNEQWIEDLPSYQKECIISTGSPNLLVGYIKAYKLLKKIQPHIVICSLWKSILLSVFYKIFNRKTLLISFFHTSYSPHFIYILLHKMLAVFQDVCFADSDVTKDYVSKFYGIKNIYTIPFIFPFSLKKRWRLIDPANIRFAYFGNVLQYKNIDRALAFCKLCKMNGLNFIFDLYTFGALEKYREKISALELTNQVSLKNTVPLSIVIDKMIEYDFLLQLSDEEGMALSVVEAMNCGLVPIVTPVGEIGKYSQDGVNAIWLDWEFDKNLPGLFSKVKNVIENPEKYDELSLGAKDAFIKYKRYNEAIIEAINLELADK